MRRSCIAFKLNYCDGGEDENHVGYRGICSYKNMHYNIFEARPPRRWCSDDDCDCKKSICRKIFRREYDLPCIESAVLHEWQVRTNENKHILEDPVGHLCVLTTRKPLAREISRFIFAIFIVREVFDEDENFGEDHSCVSADYYWRLEFRPNEATQMKFWDIFPRGNSSRLTFGQNRFRYFDDALAVKFLERAIEVKRGTPEEDFAKEFLKQYPYK